jgi:hypothetical protein
MEKQKIYPKGLTGEQILGIMYYINRANKIQLLKLQEHIDNKL